MERVTIKGGPVVGVERADPATVRKVKFVVPDNIPTHGGHAPKRQFEREKEKTAN